MPDAHMTTYDSCAKSNANVKRSFSLPQNYNHFNISFFSCGKHTNFVKDDARKEFDISDAERPLADS